MDTHPLSIAFLAGFSPSLLNRPELYQTQVLNSLMHSYLNFVHPILRASEEYNDMGLKETLETVEQQQMDYRKQHGSAPIDGLYPAVLYSRALMAHM
jgi:hypothetical protein